MKKVLYNRQFTKGEFVEQLEVELSFKMKDAYVLTTSSGTMALFIAAIALRDLRGASKVQVPVFSYIATAEAFKMAGYKIIPTDIERDSFLIKPSHVTDVVCGVDAFGNFWKPEAGGRTYMVDAAHSLGTKSVGRGRAKREIECFSLTGSKIIPAGEGGAVVTHEKDLYDHMRSIRDWAGRMSEMQAILGYHYLINLDKILKKRQEIAEYWHDKFPDVEWQTIPAQSNYYAVVGLIDYPEEFVRQNDEYEFRRYWAQPQIDLYQRYPNANYVAQHIVCFPVNPDMELK